MLNKEWIPDEYQSILDVFETEEAIKLIKDFFQNQLAAALNLKRVTAPLMVLSGTGVNDDLNGVEQPVSFSAKGLGSARVEVVQSLAKWKRLALKDLAFVPGEGLYTDMNAIRPDEDLDNLHSLYVDQWDWEQAITREDRNLFFLQDTVRKIYDAIKRTEHFLYAYYSKIQPALPLDITFIHTSALQKLYPDLSPSQRENRICEEKGAVFIIGIGAPLSDGIPHDGRAPDYDDWVTPSILGPGLNGDILVWHSLLGRALELSSMGIRVDKGSLQVQLEMTGAGERLNLDFHRRLMREELPLSIGGGIGQSRLCMFLLRKAHIGEVQSGLWSEDTREICRKHRIYLL